MRENSLHVNFYICLFPDSYFASTEFLAIGAIQGARELKIKVPQNLSIIGFDDTVLSTICDPPLTTMAQPIREMSKEGC